MVNVFLEAISATLLISASLLLYFWKKGFDNKSCTLIRRVGISVALIGIYRITQIINEVYNYYSQLNKIPALLGIVILMFSLLKYLEEKK